MCMEFAFLVKDNTEMDMFDATFIILEQMIQSQLCARHHIDDVGRCPCTRWKLQEEVSGNEVMPDISKIINDNSVKIWWT